MKKNILMLVIAVFVFGIAAHATVMGQGTNTADGVKFLVDWWNSWHF